MLGEKYLDSSHYVDGADPGDNETLYVGQDNDTYRVTNNAPYQDTFGLSDTISFGSAHSAGCNFVYGDGAVHFVSYVVNPAIFLVWGTRDSRVPGDIGEDK